MEKGLVIKANEDKVTLELENNSSCKSCGNCEIKNDKAILKDVDNTVLAKEGDTVLIENKTNSIISAALIIYAIPLLFLIIGYYFGAYLSGLMSFSSNTAIVFALLFLIVSFIAVSMIDKKVGKMRYFKPIIIKKL